jgi:HD superfamily phosphohydrolase
LATSPKVASLENLRQQIGPAIGRYLQDYKARISCARLDEKLIRDPIFGFLRLRPYEALIVDSRLFQRLRGIFQTALTFLTYPSSIHTRFEHSLNCMNLATRVLQSLEEKHPKVIGNAEKAEVRLAALLHDIGHCLFSHGSEFFYRNFPEVASVINDPEVAGGNPSESECVNYAILTSKEFLNLLWSPIKERCSTDEYCRRECGYLDDIQLSRVAQMIIGMSPGGFPNNRYMADIINGPLDVDKLDYLTRDGYFTGVNLSVDIDRLLPSLDLAYVENPITKEKERKLVVDHRGVAVVEQLLFSRMLLYDTVYHHHKVRAAQGALNSLLNRHHKKKVWPTTSGRLDSMVDFLELDEYDFYGAAYSGHLKKDIDNLRYRNLPARALVITARGLTDKKGHTKWSMRCADLTNRTDPVARQKGAIFFDGIKKKIINYVAAERKPRLDMGDILIDIPETRGYKKLGEDTLIKIHDDCVETLGKFFPFDKVINNYSKEYKYRTYVFGPETHKDLIAYAAFRAFAEEGINLNDLGLILAHQEAGTAKDLLNKKNVLIPDWRKKFYVPDLAGSASPTV